MPTDPKLVRDRFLAAAELPAAERAAYLAANCGDDAELRGAVERLLAAHEQPASVLNRPVPGGLEQTQAFSPREQPGVVIAGRYKLLEEIGEGGMGTVWVAEQTEPVRRKVALKLIKAGMDSKSVLARFEAERQALAVMDHPNIAKVHDGGLTDAGRPYFVMEYVKGIPITEYCDATRLSVPERLNLFVQVCQAVQHAHQKGIIHRDLKPSNILVAPYDDLPVPKVIDFGLAKAMHQSLTERTLHTAHETVLGTPLYMSPEQAQLNNLDVDTRSDIYSLGVLLYELLTGTTPLEKQRFKEAAWDEIKRIIREEEPPRPSTRLSSSNMLPSLAAGRQMEPARLTKLVRGELDWIVMKSLEKDRTRRYDTANGFAADVHRYLAGEPVLAAPPSARYRLRKFARKHRAGLTTAAAIALLLVAGVAVSTWQAVRATRAEADARLAELDARQAQKAEAQQRTVADTARDAEAAARKQTELALTESQRKTARMTYERAQALCEDGQVDVGLLWMAHSLELTPPGAEDLDYAIRTSINLWGQQLNTVKRQWPGPEATGSALRGEPEDVALSPDGLSVLLVPYKGNARLGEQSTHKIRFVLAPETDAPAAGEFLRGGKFSPDGRYVALARSDQRVRVWSAVTGQLVGKPLVHQEPVTGVGFDPSGKLLVTTTRTKIHFWNVETGVEEGEPVTSEHGIDGVEVGADGLHLMTWTRSPGRVIVWDFKSHKFMHSLQGVDFGVYHAGFSPDGRLVLASGGLKSDISVEPMAAQFWEAATGRPVGIRMRWQSVMTAGESVNRPCFRPDGRLLVTGGFPLRMWQVPSGKSLGAVASSMGNPRPMFLPDGKSLMYFFDYDNIRKYLLDVAPALEPVAIGAGFGDEFQSFLAFAPDARTVIRSYYHTEKRQLFCRLYELSAGKAVGEFLEAEGYKVDNGWVPVPSFSSDGRSVATVAGTNACQILDTATGREHIPRMVMDSCIRALAFSPDGRLLASGDIQGTVRLWSTATGQPVGPPIVHKRAINRICFSPDGTKLLVTGGLVSQINGEARLWDVATGQPLGPGLGITGAVRTAEFSPDGKSFATGSFQLIVWDAATSRKIWTASSSSATLQLAFTPDGRKVLARHLEENAARLYDARTGEPITPLLRHQGQVLSTALSTDGRLVLTSSADHTTRLWDTSLGLPLGPAWSDSNVGGVAFSIDGRSVLMIGDTNSLVRWEIPPPVEGIPERIRLAIEAGTRASLDPFGAFLPLAPTLQLDPMTKRPVLSSDPFEPVGKRLQELGGPPGAFRR